MDAITHALGIDPKLILTQFLGFIVLLFLLNRFVFSKVFGILDARQNDIKQVYDQLDDDRKAMETTRRQYEQRLQSIEEEAREKIQAAVKEAQSLRDNLIADAQSQAASIIEQGRNESERDRQKAFLEMRSQIVTLAVAAAGKVIDENLTDARQTKLVDDFIGSLSSSPAGQTPTGASTYVNSSVNGSAGAA